jgi:hypothetical protein
MLLQCNYKLYINLVNESFLPYFGNIGISRKGDYLVSEKTKACIYCAKWSIQVEINTR